jgi:hypothetical protein
MDFDWKNFLGDPAGYLSGTNTEGVGGVKKMLFGDKDAIKKAYEDAMNMSRQMGQESKDFLQGQKGQSLSYFGPVQQMLQNAYGQSPGIAGPQKPQMASPLAQMYGGR